MADRCYYAIPCCGSLLLQSMDVARFVFHSLVDGHVSRFYLWAVVKGAAVNIHIRVSV